jgi:hypothetical protein
LDLLCNTLSEWSKSGSFEVHGRSVASEKLGIGVAILQKVRAGAPFVTVPTGNELLAALDRISQLASSKLNTFELIRGAKVFDRDSLYVIKPIGQRFWTRTAALNDADEIAGTILMHSSKRVAW